MSFSDEEPRPQRPGRGGPQYHGTEPEDVVPHEYASDKDEVDEGGVGCLSNLVMTALGGVEDLWGQIDPRTNGADRLRKYIGQCPELLAAFFAQAALLMPVLEQMLAELDKAAARRAREGRDWGGPHPTPPADLAPMVRDSRGGDAVKEAKDRLTAKVIEILGKAGVEVDEADVESWDPEQRQEAVEWATAERQAKFWDSGVRQTNDLPRPTFLPEA